MNKETQFNLRLSASELARIKEIAAKHKKSASQYILDQCIYNLESDESDVYTEPKQEKPFKRAKKVENGASTWKPYSKSMAAK